MPMPPMPTKWILTGRERNRVMGTPVLRALRAVHALERGGPHRPEVGAAVAPALRAPAAADELGAHVRDLARRLRAAQPARRARHRLPPLGLLEDGADLVREELAREVLLLDH